MKRILSIILASFAAFQILGATLSATGSFHQQFSTGRVCSIADEGAATYSFRSKAGHGGVLGPTCTLENLAGAVMADAVMSYRDGSVYLNGGKVEFQSTAIGGESAVSDWEYQVAKEFAAGMWVAHASAEPVLEGDIFYIRHPPIYDAPGFRSAWANRVFLFDFAPSDFLEKLEEVFERYGISSPIEWWNWQTNAVKLESSANGFLLTTDTRFFVYEEDERTGAYGKYAGGMSDKPWTGGKLDKEIVRQFVAGGHRKMILSLEKINGLACLIRSLGGLTGRNMAAVPDWSPDSGSTTVYDLARKDIGARVADAAGLPDGPGESLQPLLFTNRFLLKNKALKSAFGMDGLKVAQQYFQDKGNGGEYEKFRDEYWRNMDVTSMGKSGYVELYLGEFELDP